MVLIVNSLLNVPLICLFRREDEKDPPPVTKANITTAELQPSDLTGQRASTARLSRMHQSEKQEKETTVIVNQLIKASNSWLMTTILIVTYLVFVGKIKLPCNTLLAGDGGKDFGKVTDTNPNIRK